jgi:hypothetical protein
MSMCIAAAAADGTPPYDPNSAHEFGNGDTS